MGVSHKLPLFLKYNTQITRFMPCEPPLHSRQQEVELPGLEGKHGQMHPQYIRTPAMLTGTRIRELRDRSGASRRLLAERAELHVSNLARIEQGSTNPNLDTLVRLAAALNTSVADLVRDIQSPRLTPAP